MSDTNEPTIEDMKAALLEAGRKIRSNASDESIRIEYVELQTELEAANMPQEEEKAPAPEAYQAPVSSTGETIDDVIRRANPKLGDKDPVVVAWAKANLSQDDFDKRYSGRVFARV